MRLFGRMTESEKKAWIVRRKSRLLHPDESSKVIAVCAANTDVVVVSFSIEDSHPHFLLYGTKEGCTRFKLLYEKL